MRLYVVQHITSNDKFIGQASHVKEHIELLLEDALDFFVPLQEIEVSDNLEFHVCDRSYKNLDEIQLNRLYQLGITDDISRDEICAFLAISISDDMKDLITNRVTSNNKVTKLYENVPQLIC